MITLASSLVPKMLLWLCLALAWALWRSRRGAGGHSIRFGFAVLICMWLLSTRPVAESLLQPLESQYTQVPVEELLEREDRQIVVLTSGGYGETAQLRSASLTSSSASRFLAALEMCGRIGDDCRILFSGSAGRNNRDVAAADSMKRLAVLLAPRFEYLSESASASTAEHPANVGPLLRSEEFVLVTSAFHMPRAMRSFQRHGLEPVPYPVDTLIRGDYEWQDWLPSGASLAVTSLAVREYLALFLYSLRGW